MKYNKKTFIITQTMLITLAALLCSFDMSYANTQYWWQEEVPPPGPNQVINPAYLAKKNQIDMSLMHNYRQHNATQQYYRWTRRPRAKRSDLRRGNKDTYQLVSELKKIPMYLPVTPESGTAQTADAGAGAAVGSAIGAGAGAAAIDATPMAKMIINSISFDLNSSVLKPNQATMLQEAANELKQNPDNAVMIVGHACDLGTAEYNQWLSERRAAVAREFLIKQGVDAERLTAKGVGEADPIADNTTENGRAQNRRVVFEVME